MHKALLVSEVLMEIFSHLTQSMSLDSSTIMMSLDRKSLAALARTSKTLHEPAMDLLWAKLYGIEPLLGCVTRLHPIVYRTDGQRVSADSAHFISFICRLTPDHLNVVLPSV
ncbi:hypothetical protein DEU56DRAFT_835809 [Suillus clintonianus]|uniref:uncharacterized protein n=1 Tax=Suillus clintonianus TaxID=1904413 RepID=UPI001B881033|nr:uncharacterized protein DEU56DRAFT_835809 [Suillus clintonianus]KAG2120241.1 hypothetical protein DEU56DRAFT_835809 [Suillus clintonianus]